MAPVGAAPLVQTRALVKRHYARGLLARGGSGTLAVDRVSLEIERARVFGLVGESGCGKSTLARALVWLDPPTSGDVFYDGVSLGTLSRRGLRALRTRMQIVFQDPNGALDPRMRVRQSMEEGLVTIGMPAAERERRVDELLDLVGVSPESASRYPHEFSGGQKQRIVVARALTLAPEFLVLDEPVSNLDVSVQAQIINLLLDLKERFSLTYLFITHDLHLVAYLSDRIGVMLRGRLVENASAEELLSHPLHPYTVRLFASVPGVDASHPPQPGRLADAAESVRAGCPFRPSCDRALSICAIEDPELRDVGAGHLAACHALV